MGSWDKVPGKLPGGSSISRESFYFANGNVISLLFGGAANIEKAGLATCVKYMLSILPTLLICFVRPFFRNNS